MGTTLAVAGIYASGHARPARRVGAAVLRDPRGAAGWRLLLLGAGRRVRRLGDPHLGALRRGQGRVDPERPEGVGDQRRDRQRPRRDRQRRSRAGLARARRLRRPARGGGTRAGGQGEEARPARLSHGRRPPGRLPGAGLVPARRQGEARRAPRPGPRGQGIARPGGDADLRGLQADGRRPGPRNRARRVRVRAGLREAAGPVRAADHREPGDRLHARRHEDGDRRGSDARLARRLDGAHRARSSRPPRARCRS